ncbi:unnamed protein product [Urochloa humidicola]
MEVPEQCPQGYSSILAASRDDQITLVHQSTCNDKTIQVWVHIDGDKWTLQRMIHVLPDHDRLNTFGPRSGWLLAEVGEGEEEELLIDVERGVCRPIKHLYAKNPHVSEFRMPYKMDWSTYLSKMKQF